MARAATKLDIVHTEIPATLPAVVESSAQRLAWQRSVRDADDELAMIAEQKESLRRINETERSEAETICASRISAAQSARDRIFSDADKVMTAGIEALDLRASDIEKLKAGHLAALAATE